VELSLGVAVDADAFRQQLISRIAAYALEHAGKGVQYAEVFPQHMERLRRRYYEERRTGVAKGMRALLRAAGGESDGNVAEKAEAERALERLRTASGYCNQCARETVALLLRERYS
jgi:hypothetical protein